MRLALLMDEHCGGGEITLPSGETTDAESLLKFFYNYTDLDEESRSVIHKAFDESKGVSVQKVSCIGGIGKDTQRDKKKK